MSIRYASRVDWNLRALSFGHTPYSTFSPCFVWPRHWRSTCFLLRNINSRVSLMYWFISLTRRPKTLFLQLLALQGDLRDTTAASIKGPSLLAKYTFDGFSFSNPMAPPFRQCFEIHRCFMSTRRPTDFVRDPLHCSVKCLPFQHPRLLRVVNNVGVIFLNQVFPLENICFPRFP